PATLYCWPYQVYGSCAVQIAMSSVLVSKLFTVKFSVAAVSQPPVVDATVVLYVPATLYCWPYQVYGSCAVQIAMSSVLVSKLFTVKFSVAAVSQPPVVDATVVLYVPAALYCWPYQVYGSCAVQIVISSVFVSKLFTVKFSVAAVSQPPVVDATVVLYVPAALYCWPYQVYGSCAVQIAISSVFVNRLFTVKFSVAAVSQPPVVDGTVVLYVPAALYCWPYQVYGSCVVQIAILSVFVNKLFTVKFSVAAVSQPPVVDGTVVL